VPQPGQAFSFEGKLMFDQTFFVARKMREQTPGPENWEYLSKYVDGFSVVRRKKTSMASER